MTTSQFHIEGLNVTFIAGSNSVTKQTENYNTGNVAGSNYRTICG